jgi:hypothetical protein
MKNKALLYAVESTDNLEQAKDLVRRFLLVNEDLSAMGKFDLLKYVAKNNIHPVMQGVMHENGKMIATNSYILVAVDREYSPELEGKVIDKNGLELYGTFPNWKSVVSEGCGEIHELPDAEKYRDLVRKYKLIKKQDRISGEKTRVAYKLCDDMYFLIDIFMLFYEACTELGTLQAHTYGVGRAIKAESEKGVALLMPVLGGDGLFILND